LTAAKSKPKCKFLNEKKHGPIRVASFVIAYSIQGNNEMLVEKTEQSHLSLSLSISQIDR